MGGIGVRRRRSMEIVYSYIRFSKINTIVCKEKQGKGAIHTLFFSP